MPRLRPLEPADAERFGFDGPWLRASGGDVHLAGLWSEDLLVGVVRLASMRRVRRGHAAQVAVEAVTPEHTDALLGAVCALADGWTAYDRLQLEVRADAHAARFASAHGFAAEVRRASRYPDGCDEIGFGRLRPGFSPRPPGPPPPWPARNRRHPSDVTFRLVEAGDSAWVRDLSTEPTAVWGTLQAPWSNERFYAERFAGTSPENEVYVLLADGEPAGNGGLHPTGVPGVMAMGMVVAADWQGCGLGARLLDHVIAAAAARGTRRLELGVWGDNTRARALYASRGFVAEGTLRYDSIRGGGHASSVEMALVRTSTGQG
jgi:GNAT superfamily N-acetyltransferase